MVSQLSDQPLRLPHPSYIRLQDEARPSERRKQPRINQFWHENLQEDSQAMMILLQVGSVEPGGHEVTFHDQFQGSNADEYRERIHQDKVIFVIFYT